MAAGDKGHVTVEHARAVARLVAALIRIRDQSGVKKDSMYSSDS